MKTGHILLLCILAAALVSTVVCHGPVPNDCCFEYYKRRVKKDFVSSYYETDKQCAMPAVILVTNKSFRICVKPTDPWVKKIMKTLDEKYF